MKVSLDDGELDHAGKVFGGFLHAGEDAACFLQPPDEALDDVSVSVGFTTECRGTSITITTDWHLCLF